jgi:hypothetical protein
MLALVPGAYGQPVTATPEGIAKGKNDTFLFVLPAAVPRDERPLGVELRLQQERQPPPRL